MLLLYGDLSFIPEMKYSELYRLLERDGWYIERTKGHHIYVHL